MVLVKLKGRWMQVLRFAKTVRFSSSENWFLVVTDWQVAESRRRQFRWLPASTRFDNVKEFL